MLLTKNDLFRILILFLDVHNRDGARANAFLRKRRYEFPFLKNVMSDRPETGSGSGSDQGACTAKNENESQINHSP